MRTAIAADEPDRRPAIVHYGPSPVTVNTGSAACVTVWLTPPTTAPVGSTAPYRTTAYVGTPVPEVEGAAADG